MIKIYPVGVWFDYKGDEVIYVWPWKREKFSERFMSINFCSYFKSLKEMDDEWERYFQALRECSDVQESV